MSLPIQSFDEIVQNQATAIKASTTELVDFSVGSILLALVQANAANSIWIQGLISSLLSVTRLQTSFGHDVDTFVNAFGYTRAEGNVATGTVTFSRSITSSISYIPATTTIVSASLSGIQFITTADTTSIYYNATTNQYEMPIGISSIPVPVTCMTVGTIGNVLSGQINTLVNPPSNVNSVTNSLPFTNGKNQATDAEVKAGFILYLASLSKATKGAVLAAALNTSGIKKANVVENKTYSGDTQLGYFYVVIDNGTGTATSDQITAVSNNVEEVRGLTIMKDVFSVTSLPITTLSMSLIVDTTDISARNAITANIKTAISTYISALNIGLSGKLYYSRLYQIIYDSSSHITDVASLTLSPGSPDITPTENQVITLNPNIISVSFV